MPPVKLIHYLQYQHINRFEADIEHDARSLLSKPPPQSPLDASLLFFTPETLKTCTFLVNRVAGGARFVKRERCMNALGVIILLVSLGNVCLENTNARWAVSTA